MRNHRRFNVRFSLRRFHTFPQWYHHLEFQRMKMLDALNILRTRPFVRTFRFNLTKCSRGGHIHLGSSKISYCIYNDIVLSTFRVYDRSPWAVLYADNKMLHLRPLDLSFQPGRTVTLSTTLKSTPYPHFLSTHQYHRSLFPRSISAPTLHPSQYSYILQQPLPKYP
jgi:hypothetical protein